MQILRLVQSSQTLNDFYRRFTPAAWLQLGRDPSSKRGRCSRKGRPRWRKEAGVEMERSKSSQFVRPEKLHHLLSKICIFFKGYQRDPCHVLLAKIPKESQERLENRIILLSIIFRVTWSKFLAKISEGKYITQIWWRIIVIKVAVEQKSRGDYFQMTSLCKI